MRPTSCSPAGKDVASDGNQSPSTSTRRVSQPRGRDRDAARGRSLPARRTAFGQADRAIFDARFQGNRLRVHVDAEPRAAGFDPQRLSGRLTQPEPHRPRRASQRVARPPPAPRTSKPGTPNAASRTTVTAEPGGLDIVVGCKDSGRRGGDPGRPLSRAFAARGPWMPNSARPA